MCVYGFPTYPIFLCLTYHFYGHFGLSTVKLGDDDVNKQILLNIISTLSDKDATQVKFNELLEEYRTEILQEKLGNAWNDMSELEQLSISKLNNFFVDYMLSLVHAVEAASSCLIEFEKGALI
jgi:hypothetical protein